MKPTVRIVIVLFALVVCFDLTSRATAAAAATSLSASRATAVTAAIYVFAPRATSVTAAISMLPPRATSVTAAISVLPPRTTSATATTAVISAPVPLETPPSADEVVKQACTEAAAAKKKVMVIFHASWCGWCHKLDTMMASPECKPLFDANFVVCHLTIAESPGNRNLENPGAEALYEKYADQNSGIPFILIMDANGTVIADSRIKPHGAKPGSSGDNIGYPSSGTEVDYYLRTLRETSNLTPAQLRIIKERLAKK